MGIHYNDFPRTSGADSSLCYGYDKINIGHPREPAGWVEHFIQSRSLELRLENFFNQKEPDLKADHCCALRPSNKRSVVLDTQEHVAEKIKHYAIPAETANNQRCLSS